GDFGATTVTEPDGTFAFSGIPVGKRHLYLSDGGRRGWEDWVRIEAFEIGAAPRNLGRIDCHTGKLTVNVVGDFSKPTDDVNLHDYDPNAVRVRIAVRHLVPHAKGGPFIFENVSLGKYDVAGWGEERAHINRMIEITPDNLNPTVTLEWPKGTASIRGTIDASLRKLAGNGSWYELYSPNIRWWIWVPVQDDGRFELKGIPAGSYCLAMNHWKGARIATTLADIQLRDGETKTLNLAPANVPAGELEKEVVKVTAFTSQGIPLPGTDIRLIGPSGPVKPNDRRSGHFVFVATPGFYQLSAAFPGTQSVTQTVEIKPTPQDAPPQLRAHEFDVTLGPSD
ncbi:MAG TPA: hypothetical protein VEI07_24840, partial [Planctomycetaceae bacterium]|nr:hypothetical protein [Planctomycetaceae bacterium]